ncbi:hypothetical protein I3842_05G236400 [Carya illinoinensis]|uniref:Uncharacterized protein n=1 Tax=Carya illinoinensis TaxID=32201 RepID=A0A922JP63_CARIL|nr:hypothetical protein I3842_05G236400 [Carya illinoinensis]
MACSRSFNVRASILLIFIATICMFMMVVAGRPYDGVKTTPPAAADPSRHHP